MKPIKVRSPKTEQLILDLLKASLPKTKVKIVKSRAEVMIKLYNYKWVYLGYAKIGEEFGRSYKPKQRCLFVYYTDLKEKYRGKGFGQCLYREILKYGQKNGFVYLCSNSISDQALRTRSILMNNCEKYRRQPFKIKIPNLIY